MLGALIGALLAGMISDKLGRNKALLIDDALLVTGSVIMTLAPNIIVLVLGRIIVGIGVGIASLVVPLMITELSTKELRGSIGVLNQFYINLGKNQKFFFFIVFIFKLSLNFLKIFILFYFILLNYFLFIFILF